MGPAALSASVTRRAGSFILRSSRPFVVTSVSFRVRLRSVFIASRCLTSMASIASSAVEDERAAKILPQWNQRAVRMRAGPGSREFDRPPAARLTYRAAAR